MSHEFDVQRQSPFTPEGQIEAAGHFSRGLATRYGAERLRRVIGRTALAVAAAAAVLAVLAAIG